MKALLAFVLTLAVALASSSDVEVVTSSAAVATAEQTSASTLVINAGDAAAADLDLDADEEDELDLDEEEEEEELDEEADDEEDEADLDEEADEELDAAEEEVAAAETDTQTDAEVESELMGAAPLPGVNGVDFSVSLKQNNFACFRSAAANAAAGKLSRTVPLKALKGTGPNYTPALQASIAVTDFTKLSVRAPLLDGKPLKATVDAAVKAGYKPADISAYYISFEAHVSAADTVKRIAAALDGVTPNINTLWLDIEGSLDGRTWDKVAATNCKKLAAVVAGIKADKTKRFPPKLGVYTAASQWTKLMGAACDFAPFKALPLWYASYDGTFNTFKDFKPITKAWPAAYGHQWHGTTSFCGAVVDFNLFKDASY